MKTFFTAVSASVLPVLISTTTMAAPVEVEYSVTGSPGNWIVEFSVENNIAPAPADMAIYYFGVAVSERNIIGSPAGWDPDYMTVYDTDYAFPYAYNNIWFNFPDSTLTPFSALDGFSIRVSSLAAPTTPIPWVAVAWSDTGYYEGVDMIFLCCANPGFKGFATPAAVVPEPSRLALTFAGLGLLYFSLRRRGLPT